MGMAMMGTGYGRGESRAITATEAAINSPLLEDIDLKGASGILVNITGGLDLSLGEFSEVGDIVEGYASDGATVVVGTVIDPEMSDEIKVTVVATGLCKAQEAARVSGSDTRSGGTSSRKSGDYGQLDLPSVARTRRDEKPAAVAKAVKKPEMAAPLPEEMKRTGTDDMDFLDIPAFLRRQAD
jgi:cell division protein FtsZ